MFNPLIILIMIVSSLLGAFGQVALKKGAKAFKLTFKGILNNKQFLSGVTLYGFAVIIFLGVLKYAELSYVYPLVSMSYIWVTLFSNKMLGEKMNKWKIIGIVLLIVGIVLINLE
ncbi:MAG: EamA family transporter [Candidatus Woesearchaeota archaeon]